MPVDERVARSVALEQAYVHDVYEQFCDNPRSKPWPKVQQFLEDLDPGAIVCDVGCGNGKYMNVNSSIFNIGGDKSARLCDVAREKEKEVLTLDNLQLPFRDGSLDAVVSIAVVHHLATAERRVRAIRELARVLRIGGRLIISVWAMEQSHRRFESQDVLVPWHRPQQLSTPSLELTSTTTTSEDDGAVVYHAYTQTSDSDSNRSLGSRGINRKRGKGRHKGRSIDPGRNSSPSSSSLSSPNETCYSFVRKALQKLAGGRRVGVHRPWFLESWSACANKEPTTKRYDPNGCECCDCIENIQDLPIELRRIDDEDIPQRRQTFPSSQLINDLASNLKSKSMTNIKTVENNNIIRSQSGTPSIQETGEPETPPVSCTSTGTGTGTAASIGPSKSLMKPKLVKQKKSICEDDEEALDQPTDMKSPLTTYKAFPGRHRNSVFKQRSLNEELMSTDRMEEKERVRQNIQKQASLNEDMIYRRHGFDSLKDSLFSVSTSKRFQLIKTGFTNKIKRSTTNIEKVTGASLRNGFVRMFQQWKSTDVISPTIPEDKTVDTLTATSTEEKKESVIERRHSKEDGSDSSKDSSLQSDTSVDSEDSFASVIFVPKSDPMSPAPLSPGPASPRLKSVPNSPRVKQSSCPTSPRIKQMPLTTFPLTKQLSSPKPSIDSSTFSDKSERDHVTPSTTRKNCNSLAQKYSVPQIPKFRRTSLNTPTSTTSTVSPEKSPIEISESVADRLKKIKQILSEKPGFGSRKKSTYPIVRHSSVTNGKVEAIAKPIPKLLTLELFNPETDDKDSDSSAVSSPDSVDSVIVNGRGDGKKKGRSKTKFVFPPKEKSSDTQSKNNMSLFEAAADVANSLDEAVDRVIKSSPKTKKRQIRSGEVLSILRRQYSTDSMLLLDDNGKSSWNEDCHKHLSDFADKLSEKLLKEIDQYREKYRERSLSTTSIDDPYIQRLSEELDDLSKVSEEIKKQNEYLAQLSIRDNLFNRLCIKCKEIDCKCCERTKIVKKIEPKPVTPDNDPSCAEIKSEKSNEPSNSERESSEAGSNDCSDLTKSSKLSVGKTSIKKGASTDSGDSEDKGSSTNSIISSVATSINFGPSMESTDGLSESHKDSCSISRYSNSGSTASLASCPDWKTIKTRSDERLSKDTSSISLESSSARREKAGSQDSLPSDNIGGEITYHRYYHVFREGELDQLIEKYVENLHIISSYYDHASWCIIAEKVQVWTI